MPRKYIKKPPKCMDEKTIIAAAKEVISKKLDIVQAAKKHNVTQVSIRRRVKILRGARKRFVYSHETLEAAVHHLRQKNHSLSWVSKHYGVPRSTLSARLKSPHPLARKMTGKGTALPYEEEEAIKKWILEMSTKEGTQAWQTIARTVQEVLNERGLKVFKNNNKPTSGWLQAFLRRHPELRKIRIGYWTTGIVGDPTKSKESKDTLEVKVVVPGLEDEDEEDYSNIIEEYTTEESSDELEEELLNSKENILRKDAIKVEAEDIQPSGGGKEASEMPLLHKENLAVVLKKQKTLHTQDTKASLGETEFLPGSKVSTSPSSLEELSPKAQRASITPDSLDNVLSRIKADESSPKLDGLSSKLEKSPKSNDPSSRGLSDSKLNGVPLEALSMDLNVLSPEPSDSSLDVRSPSSESNGSSLDVCILSPEPSDSCSQLECPSLHLSDSSMEADNFPVLSRSSPNISSPSDPNDSGPGWYGLSPVLGASSPKVNGLFRKLSDSLPQQTSVSFKMCSSSLQLNSFGGETCKVLSNQVKAEVGDQDGLGGNISESEGGGASRGNEDGGVGVKGNGNRVTDKGKQDGGVVKVTEIGRKQGGKRIKRKGKEGGGFGVGAKVKVNVEKWEGEGEERVEGGGKRETEESLGQRVAEASLKGVGREGGAAVAVRKGKKGVGAGRYVGSGIERERGAEAGVGVGVRVGEGFGKGEGGATKGLRKGEVGEGIMEGGAGVRVGLGRGEGVARVRIGSGEVVGLGGGRGKGKGQKVGIVSLGVREKRGKAEGEAVADGVGVGLGKVSGGGTVVGKVGRGKSDSGVSAHKVIRVLLRNVPKSQVMQKPEEPVKCAAKKPGEGPYKLLFLPSPSGPKKLPFVFPKENLNTLPFKMTAFRSYDQNDSCTEQHTSADTTRGTQSEARREGTTKVLFVPGSKISGNADQKLISWNDGQYSTAGSFQINSENVPKASLKCPDPSGDQVKQKALSPLKKPCDNSLSNEDAEFLRDLEESAFSVQEPDGPELESTCQKSVMGNKKKTKRVKEEEAVNIETVKKPRISVKKASSLMREPSTERETPYIRDDENTSCTASITKEDSQQKVSADYVAGLETMYGVILSCIGIERLNQYLQLVKDGRMPDDPLFQTWEKAKRMVEEAKAEMEMSSPDSNQDIDGNRDMLVPLMEVDEAEAKYLYVPNTDDNNGNPLARLEGSSCVLSGEAYELLSDNLWEEDVKMEIVDPEDVKPLLELEVEKMEPQEAESSGPTDPKPGSVAEESEVRFSGRQKRKSKKKCPCCS
ncbi:uncharacterized protein LOC134778765 [Penaeus indicus]|uniref:uncharacterized protein LOC134778765 n=1 Tax=Penaeus indicus TaxID=29960 RepID=UPI00300C5694